MFCGKLFPAQIYIFICEAPIFDHFNGKLIFETSMEGQLILVVFEMKNIELLSFITF
jgi:hypothetical protein